MFKGVLAAVGRAVERELKEQGKEWSPNQLKPGMKARVNLFLEVESKPAVEEGESPREVLVINVAVTPFLQKEPSLERYGGVHEVQMTREVLQDMVEVPKSESTS